MVISGIETVGFVPVVAGVPEFGATSWFGKIREEGKYDKVPSGIKLSKGSEIGAGHLFSFEFTTVDITGFDANNSANDFANDIEGGFEFWCFAYGLSNVLWREAVTPVISFNRDNKSGELKSITFKMSVHRGSNADIKAGANLLRDEVANASYSAGNWDDTNVTILASQAASGSFTGAEGSVYTLNDGTNAVASLAELNGHTDKLPIPPLATFYIKGMGYRSAGACAIKLIPYTEADVQVGLSSVTVTNNAFVEGTLTQGTGAKYVTFALGLTADAGSALGEFNRLFVGYKGISRAYSET